MKNIKRKLRKYAYGDYYGDPTKSLFKESDIYGEQKEIKLLPNSNNQIEKDIQENTKKPNNYPSNYQSNMDSIGNYARIANTALQSTGISQNQGKYDQTVESAASAVPIWGEVYNLTRSVSDGIKGEGTNKNSSALANYLSPSSGVTEALDTGNFGDAVVAGFLPGLGGQQSSKRRQKEEETKKRMMEAEMQKNYALPQNYSTSGYGKYGMKFYHGGKLPNPTDGSELNQLSSNMAQYKGNTHENGGIELDTNSDSNSDIEIEDKEVIKDNMVLSDRLKPSTNIKELVNKFGVKMQNNDTYASISTRIGNKIGKFEEKLNSTRLGEKNTARITIDRLNEVVNSLFQDQEIQNIGRKKGLPNKRQFGGALINENMSMTDPKTGNPPFKTEKEHIDYYRQRAVEAFSDDDLVVYNRFLKEGGQSTADAMIALRGGLPTYAQVKEPFVPTNPTDWNKLGYETPKVGGYRYGARSGKGLPAKGSITRRPWGGFIDDNYGDIANVIGFAANKRQINNLETSYDPTLINQPNYNYRDRTSFLKNEIGKQFNTASQGINQSSSQDNIALKSNMYANTLNSLNQALDSESQRKDSLDFNYTQLANRVNTQNAQLQNYSKELGMNNRNERRALTQANIDSLIRGTMGNKNQKDLRQLDWDKAYLEAINSGDRGVIERLIEQMPEDMRKRRYGNYNPTLNKKYVAKKIKFNPDSVAKRLNEDTTEYNFNN